MKTPLISLVVAGIGLPCIHECLGSLERNGSPDEVIIAIDVVGQGLTNTRQYQRFRTQLIGRYPWLAGTRANLCFESWALTNQTLNLGIRATTGKYVSVTHEDVTYPPNLLWYVLECELRTIHERQAKGEWLDVVGLCWRTRTIEGQQTSHFPLLDHDCQVQAVPPVSFAIERAFYDEIGGFDETKGIWYDAQLQAELKARGKWLLYLNYLSVDHYCSQSMHATNWADGWKHASIWEHFDHNFEKEYGYPFRRDEFAVRML